ncbi:Holliday junction resolvase RuvX [Proteiniclasticum sp. SCR006]|uniref:Putative pre-16S rRNA nuclease n=1 Tax=Proteiniclasticum aestuarii TaxID=2817862 RepID=A0A939H6Z7_9CLOT|nr:Holliday junction resolvase RuvX [Proteiniclasticum aestuarii]MBO1263629.1 Holliday junction resolvase RuvX [Proteiniclasticum aestuarii]
MRYIGLDVGDRTIGVAVSDPLGYTAQGITTVRRKSLEKDFEKLREIFKDYEILGIVVGLPKNMNGTIGPQAEKAMEFGRVLEEEFGHKVIYWDERLTTMAAHRAMLEADMSRKKRKTLVDKIAATYILQGYLDKISSTK